jgi:uncharacterized membrane protein (UPF0127 family)
MSKRFVYVCLLLALAACDSKPGENDLPETHMQIGGQPFTLEMAVTPKDQEIGLMHRDHLDADHGMIFIFPDEAVRTFWNHDVSFSLDLVFLDASQHIVSIKRLQTYSEADISSDVPAEYAIELNAGTAAQLHLQPGMQITIPPEARSVTQPSPTTAR